jgi:hypothetical protein
MSMWDFYLMAAVRAIEKSMAYALYRLMLCLGAALGYLLATLAGAGTLIGFGSLAKNASSLGPYGAVIGFALFAWLMFKLRPTWLNAVNVPQLALLADEARGETLPTGKALVDYANRRRAECFPSTSRLFELDEAIRQVQGDMAELHPCPKLPADSPKVRDYAMRLTRWLSGLNHQTLLAWHFHTGSNNDWLSAAEGLAVHERHFTRMTKNRMFAMLFSWLGFLAAYPLLLEGIRMLVDGIPIDMSFWPYVFAGVFAWTVKAAFFDAIAEASMMQVFFPLARSEASGGAAEALIRHSSAYRRMREKAGAVPE